MGVQVPNMTSHLVSAGTRPGNKTPRHVRKIFNKSFIFLINFVQKSVPMRSFIIHFSTDGTGKKLGALSQNLKRNFTDSNRDTGRSQTSR